MPGRATDGRWSTTRVRADPSVAQGRFNTADLFTVLLDQPPRVRPLANTPAHEALADIAPDGTMVAYMSSETGRSEIFVETFRKSAAGGR